MNIKLWPILDVLGRDRGLDSFMRERLYDAISECSVDEIREAVHGDIKEFYKEIYLAEGDIPVEAGKTGDRIAGSRLSVILTGKANFDIIKKESEKLDPVDTNRMSTYSKLLK